MENLIGQIRLKAVNEKNYYVILLYLILITLIEIFLSGKYSSY